MQLNTRTSKDRIATINITLEVQDIAQLNQVIKEIKKVDSVYEVTRKKQNIKYKAFRGGKN